MPSSNKSPEDGARDVLRLLGQFLSKQLGKENPGPGFDTRSWAVLDEKFLGGLKSFRGTLANTVAGCLIWLWF